MPACVRTSNRRGTYGPSTPGTLNVIAGQTYGVACSAPGASFAVFNSPGACAAPGVTPTLPGSPLPLAAGQGTMFSDADPYFDVCTNQSINSQMAGANIGDVLGSHGITWGFFTGGFASPGTSRATRRATPSAVPSAPGATTTSPARR